MLKLIIYTKVKFLEDISFENQERILSESR